MSEIKIAYFSAEIGIDPKIKTYSGGLGILAGDTIKAMADLEVPFCAVTLLYKHGYFEQDIRDNLQVELDDEWDFMKILQETNRHIRMNISGEDITIKIWKYEYEGVTGHKVPIFFLDTDIHTNPQWAQEITSRLYQGDRISQEMVLGIGGIRALDALGIYDGIQKFHMNEGHSAFLTLELYKRLGHKVGWDDSITRKYCVFTTHTPIPAGHDKFDYNDVYEKFKGEPDLIPWHIKKIAGEDKLNMTLLAMSFSNYINAVSRKHREVTEEMFPSHNINYITNGIHIPSWASQHMQDIYDRTCPGWKTDPLQLKKISEITDEEIISAHQKSKKEFIEFANKHDIVGSGLSEDVLTIGFARRFIQYKDAELIFRNMNNLIKLGKKVQFIFAGKAHARDGVGKSIMKNVIERAIELKGSVSIAFLPNYNIELAKKMVQGCDMWLNTPIPPNEASGTSGMKAAANGCLHFSRLDGWSIEAYEMNGGGFPISEYQDFIMNLQYKIIPMYYSENKTSWAREMKLSITNSASHFNTHRMAREYTKKAYKL